MVPISSTRNSFRIIIGHTHIRVDNNNSNNNNNNNYNKKNPFEACKIIYSGALKRRWKMIFETGVMKIYVYIGLSINVTANNIYKNQLGTYAYGSVLVRFGSILPLLYLLCIKILKLP